MSIGKNGRWAWVFLTFGLFNSTNECVVLRRMMSGSFRKCLKYSAPRTACSVVMPSQRPCWACGSCCPPCGLLKRRATVALNIATSPPPKSIVDIERSCATSIGRSPLLVSCRKGYSKHYVILRHRCHPHGCRGKTNAPSLAFLPHRPQHVFRCSKGSPPWPPTRKSPLPLNLMFPVSAILTTPPPAPSNPAPNSTSPSG